MSSAEQPGKGNPKSKDSPQDVLPAGDVEKTLGKLESITATLAQEVGTPDRQASDGQPGNAAPAEAKAESEPVKTAVEAAPADGAAKSNQLDGAALQALPQEKAETPAQTQPADDQQALPMQEVAGQQQQSGASVAATDRQAATPVAQEAAAQPERAASADEQAEIDQEINQALDQLQGKKPAAAKDGPTAGADESGEASAGAETPGLVRRAGRLCLGGIDVLMAPVVLVAQVVNWPVRWLPSFLRELLGYAAIGTTVMAAVLWVYLLVVKH